MSEEEGKLMQEHVKYWRDLFDRRIAVIFGPVADLKEYMVLQSLKVKMKPLSMTLDKRSRN